MQKKLAGFDQVPIKGHGGGAYTAGPVRLVLHTTEGDSIAGAIAAYRANGTPPHITVDPTTGQKFQHVDLDRSAYAMRNLPGGVETNRLHAIQVEIVGRAGQMHNMPDLEVVWMGVELLAPLQRATGFTWDHPGFVGTEAGTIATTTAPQRMSRAQWNSFAGICGHQHVPENHHWDPGRARVDGMIAFAKASQQPVPPPPIETPQIPIDKQDARLRRLAAGTYLESLGDLPIPMSPSGGGNALHVILLQRILNLLFPAARLVENGVYDQATANVVVVFQTLINQLSPGSIDDAFPGVLSNKTKFYMGLALRNIRDRQA